jgi:ribosome-binding factor A
VFLAGEVRQETPRAKGAATHSKRPCDPKRVEMARDTRVLRVADRIRDEVSEILAREIKDPRMGFITVTRVELSRDLRHAKVMYSTIGSPEERKKTRAALESAKGYIRRRIGRSIPLRFCPEILFCYDMSIEEGLKIEQILKEIKDTEC